MAWTNITIDTSWQNYDVAVEIADAINMRLDLLAAGATLYDTHKITPLGMTVYAFVKKAQESVEFMGSTTPCYFYDDYATLASYVGQTSYPSPYADLQAIMTAAGLTETGYWRRAPHNSAAPADWTAYNDPVFAGNYGKIEDKDLAGPWLFKDLQLVLTKMRRLNVGTSGFLGGFSANATVGTHTPGTADVVFPATVPVTAGPAASTSSTVNMYKCKATNTGFVDRIEAFFSLKSYYIYAPASYVDQYAGVVILSKVTIPTNNVTPSTLSVFDGFVNPTSLVSGRTAEVAVFDRTGGTVLYVEAIITVNSRIIPENDGTFSIDMNRLAGELVPGASVPTGRDRRVWIEADAVKTLLDLKSTVN